MLALCAFAALGFASRSKLVPRSNAESTASFKAYQLSAPGVESEAFKAAEKKRTERAGGAAKQESSADAIQRLGLRSYGDALDAGFDECKTWRGCNQNK